MPAFDSTMKNSIFFMNSAQINVLYGLNVTVSMKFSLTVLSHVKHRITISPNGTIPRYTPEKSGNRGPHNNYMQMFLVVLILIANSNSQPQYTNDKWINKIHHIYSPQYYQSTKGTKYYNIDT